MIINFSWWGHQRRHNADSRIQALPQAGILLAKRFDLDLRTSLTKIKYSGNYVRKFLNYLR